MQEDEKWVSMKQICDHLGFSRDTVKKLINNDGLPGYKIDRKWKFKVSEVDNWIRTRNNVNNKCEVAHDAEND